MTRNWKIKHYSRHHLKGVRETACLRKHRKILNKYRSYRYRLLRISGAETRIVFQRGMK